MLLIKFLLILKCINYNNKKLNFTKNKSPQILFFNENATLYVFEVFAAHDTKQKQ